MIEGVIMKKLHKYVDERGWLMEAYRLDEDEYQPVMAYISLTEPGVIRGPHEHRYQADCFVFPGPGTFELHLWDHREASPSFGQYLRAEFGVDNPTMVIVPPGVVHGYKCISQEAALSINLPDKLYKGPDKKDPEIDEIRWEKDPHSPFKII